MFASDRDALAVTGSSIASHDGNMSRTHLAHHELESVIIIYCYYYYYCYYGNMQIVAWVDKLASKLKGKEPDPKETKWRQRAADAIVLHCMHDLLVSLGVC